MANSNKTFVSAGVYTSEKDLTFVAQSVGVTTLGLVGETLKGPAFEPILIKNFDEYRTYFGPNTPTKYGNGNPRYELGYVAKSYLQESSQLFVTRVLGKSGYRTNKSFGIKTLGGVTVDLVTAPSVATPETGIANDLSDYTLLSALSGKTSIDGTLIPAYVNTIIPSDGDWFTIGYVEPANLLVEADRLSSPIGDFNNKNWYNNFFVGEPVTGVESYLFEYESINSGWTVTQYTFAAETNTEYDDLIVASFRSRGSYISEVLTLEVDSDASFLISSTDFSNNPLGEFTLSVTGTTGGALSYTCSLDTTSPKYITKVLGSSVFDKSKVNFPVYVDETYPKLLKSLFEQGLIRGLSTDVVYHSVNTDFIHEWETPGSPTVVSEIRGGKADPLFDVISISDGDSANVEIKITIQNINIETGEFDILVRDFNDTDENVVSLEKFSRCSMNPDLPGYVAKKVGTVDDEYQLRSKYIMLNMYDNAPVDAFPAGFKGFTSSLLSTSKIGEVMYKTSYYESGDVIRYTINGQPITTNGDKVRKVSLGLSSQIGFDSDLFHYKGVAANSTTLGFHLSSNAPIDEFKSTPYDLEGTEKGLLENINYRKFTFGVCGGFDGWDIYREDRTNGNGYIFNNTTITNTYYRNLITNGGVFSDSVGTSDHYAYLEGFETFSNPESIDINVFATPGINYSDHSVLTTSAIDMIEEDRSDSIYIINAPNLPSSDEVISSLDDVGIDSNYSATYWPWIQVKDTDNGTQLYLPPTGEVIRNIALTDNVSYPWFASAGYSRGLVNAIKAQKKLRLDERDDLYKNRINPIATFSDTGAIIWGNKTLQLRESALDRMNVRRLLLRTRKLISAVAVRLLFDQDDEQIKGEFIRLVNPILEAIKKERGLYAFSVKIIDDPEDIDSNTLRGKIYIKPTRSLEFIDVEFLLTPTGASFENI